MSEKFHNVNVFTITEDKEWEKIGTGKISSKYIDRLQGICLLVHSESDGSLILEYKIETHVSYQKQENIIIWSEARNHSMAIHFEDPDGCQAIWKDICEVQGKDSSVDITQDLPSGLERFTKMPQIWNLDETAKCKLSTLQYISYLLNSGFDNPKHKEDLALMLENEGYIKKLLQLFRDSEIEGNIEALHHLYSVVKGILFLDNYSLFDIMFSEECIMDVVGCLEYDPRLDEPRQHRQFLTQNAKFKEVMPIAHSELQEKIHQTYRVQYIHDILLPIQSIFEENLLSDLRNFIFFNKIEIVTMLQEDQMFLSNVFAQLKDEAIDSERRCELLLFFKEFCEFSQALLPKKRQILLKIMIEHGIMPILKVIIQKNHCRIKVAAIHIFTLLVDYNPCIVQQYAMKEAQECKDDDDLLINIIIAQLICDADPEFSPHINLVGVLHCLLDLENLKKAKEFERREFLNFFYTRCMHTLIAPLLSIAAQKDSEDYIFEPDKEELCPDNYQTAQMLSLILGLLTFCVEHHPTHIQNCILSKNLLKTVLVLMSSKHTFLILSVVRFMRKMIGLKDEIYNHYIINRNLFEPVVNAFVSNGTRYNMLNSAIIELFEFIKEENISSLVTHIVEKFFVAFESTEYVQTFKELKIKPSTVTEVKVKEEICSKKKEQETALSSMGSDFPSCYNVFMETKGKKSNENKEHPERESSDAFRYSSSYPDGDSNRMNRAHSSPRVASVNLDDDDNDNNDNGDGEQDDKNEDEEDKSPPSKRPNLSL
ncbi:protein PPP4R3C-like [Nannospalax galili]|uniref:protein PPP4R3C-like n=1 Tax=Nannospalax galili TaxID=1026970 RepID=UPI0004ED075D|nr:protein PPP4R3C-like [Nannospalax galili]